MIKSKTKLAYPVLIVVGIFMIISILSIYSAMTYLPTYLGNLALKQGIYYMIGITLALFLMKFPMSIIEKGITPMYILGNILLFLLLFIGKDVNGSKCWFIIPGIGSFQPSEFMKIILILTVAKETKNFFQKSKNPTIKEEFFFLLKILFLVMIPSILTFLEPDTGAVIIYLLITLGILLISPLKRRWFVLSIGIISILLVGFLYLYYQKQDVFLDIFGTNLFYRIDRILDWKKGEGLQLENSLTAIGSSGLFGHGWNKTPLYFPESGTDFIFSVFASNFGLIPSLFFLGIILIFDIYLINQAQEETNHFYKYILIGITSLFLYQQLQNISMTFGLLPITGITLPFISYGGSSLLSYLILIGLILNIYNSKKIIREL